MILLSDHDRWRDQTYTPAVNRFPERKPHFETSSGILLPPVICQNKAFNRTYF